jgi:hypothetical protein
LYANSLRSIRPSCAGERWIEGRAGARIEWIRVTGVVRGDLVLEQRLFVRRIAGAALVAPDQCPDLLRDTDRGPADQLPRLGDPMLAA